MENKQMIQNNSLWLKVKRKIYNFICIFSRNDKQKIQKNKDKKYNKERILKLYRDFKKKKINVHSLDDTELKMLTQLVKQEINILKKRLDEEITETKINERQVKYSKQKVADLKK